MTQVCRICREVGGTLVDIFKESNGKPSLAQIITECTNCTVDCNDSLPQMMCNACILTAQHSYRFKRKCEESHAFFLRMLEEKGIEEERMELKHEIFESEKDSHEEWPTKVDICIVEDPQLVVDDTHNQSFDECTSYESDSDSDNLLAPLKRNGNGYKCPFCNIEFATNKVRLLHMKSKHNQSHKCEICSKTFISAVQLKYHILSHSDQRPFKCLYCPETFMKTGKLRNHEKLHERNQLDGHKCYACSQIFPTSYLLKRHVQVHSGKRRYQCRYCQKSFSSASYLAVHENVHVK